jgi:hypothetical protein
MACLPAAEPEQLCAVMDRAALRLATARRRLEIGAAAASYGPIRGRTARIGDKILHPFAQHVLVGVQVSSHLRDAYTAVLYRATASISNSRPNRRRYVARRWLHGHPISTAGRVYSTAQLTLGVSWFRLPERTFALAPPAKPVPTRKIQCDAYRFPPRTEPRSQSPPFQRTLSERTRDRFQPRRECVARGSLHRGWRAN